MKTGFVNRLERHSAGVTLTELLVVITIVGLLMAMGVPTYRNITDSSRIASEVNGLLGDMQLARSEAVKQGLPVTVCVSSNGTACLASGNWASGWIIFLDNNGNRTVDAGPPADVLVKVQAPFSGTDTFVSDNPTAATFNREGFATLTAAGTTYNSALITLNAATATAASTRCLTLNQLGKMAVQKVGAGGCT